MLYYRALMDAATIGDAIGQTSAAATYRTQAARLASAINAAMYDATTGIYRISDTVPAIAQDTNVLAGLPPAGQAPRVMANLKTALWTTPYGPLPYNWSFWRPLVSTFMSGYEAQARYSINDAAGAETLMRTVFGWMINPANPDATGTMWENIAADGTPGLTNQTSLSHGWATGAVSALSGYALGIRPASPGFDTWLVQPHPGTLAWVEGQAPTPHGLLAVKWAQQSGQFAMQVDAPGSTTGTIAIPTLGARNATVILDGATVWSKGAAVGASTTTRASTDGQFIYLPAILPGKHMVSLNP